MHNRDDQSCLSPQFKYMIFRIFICIYHLSYAFLFSAVLFFGVVVIVVYSDVVFSLLLFFFDS